MCLCVVLRVLLQAAREAAKRLAVEKGIADIDRARPIPDPQDTGLIKGIKAVREQQQRQQQQQEAQQQQQQQQQDGQQQQQ
jgi:Ca-activated chloride channel family protein